MKTQPIFPDIVGQTIAKRRLGFHLDNYKATNVLPHLLFIAPKGCGKTTLAKATARNLVGTDGKGKPKPFLELNCSTLKSVKQFINQVVIPHVNHRECTVLFDEASELPKDVSMALLTMLNPNKENRTTFSYEDYTIDFDFRRQSFMFATTEAHKLFHALIDRCDRIDMEEYTYSELGRIIQANIPDVKFDKGLLDEIAPVLRGNARAAQKMANHIIAIVARKNPYTGHLSERFTRLDWKELSYALGILPLGLSRIEIQILRALAEKKECSLTNLSAKTGLTAQCIRQDFELYLQKHNLMDISTGGRSITADGQLYLKEFDKMETNK
jgi:Holliday junction resolvasome RuvABC ATP-dependent DNA helicase subunit